MERCPLLRPGLSIDPDQDLIFVQLLVVSSEVNQQLGLAFLVLEGCVVQQGHALIVGHLCHWQIVEPLQQISQHEVLWAVQLSQDEVQVVGFSLHQWDQLRRLRAELVLD